MSLSAAQVLLDREVELPTLPQVVLKLNALVDDPEVGVREIGEVVAADAPIAAKVLRIANSAYFGLRERVISTEHASAVLGIRMLRTVAMQASVISRYEHLRGNRVLDFEELWRHSILTGQTCAALAGKCRARIALAPEEFQVVGLLHDVGKVLLLEAKAEEYLSILRTSRRTGCPEHVLEQQSLGFHHGHLGALIASRWGLPKLVAECVEHHHAARDAAGVSTASTLVAVVNQAVHEVERHDAQAALAAFDERARKALGLREIDVEQVLEQARAWLPQIQV